MIDDLVSVITPMYNAEKYIAEAITSVQAQTYKNWEMIIVDDASSDRSAAIVKQYVKQDNRIHYYRRNKNMGVAAARNAALHRAKGRYVAFLDIDDMWKEKKMEIQLKYMKEQRVSFSYTACEVIAHDGNKTGRIRYVPEKVDYKELLKGNVIPCLTVMIDRHMIPDIEMPDIHHEDYATWLTITKKGITAYGINEILAQYRMGKSSVSSNKLKAMKWTWQIYRNYLGLDVPVSILYFFSYLGKSFRKYI